MLQFKLAALASLYFVSSSTLLVLNKVAITGIPNAAVLLVTQVLSTVICLLPAGILFGVRLSLTPTFEVVRAYVSVAFVFLCTIYSNFRLVHEVGVNFFIILRCSTPLLVSVVEWSFMGRELPQGRSLLALLGILVSGFAYAYSHLSGFSSTSTAQNYYKGALWAAAWLVSFTLDMSFIKHVVDKYDCNSLERTLYQNAGALPLLAIILVSPVERWSLREVFYLGTNASYAALYLSCVAGTILSFTGMTLRSHMSATMFTVMGIVCKMASCFLNELFVEPEKNIFSLISILAAVVCSSL